MIDLNTVIKAYDIRGTYPDQLNEDLAYRIGKALSDFLLHASIAVGRDMRASSPALHDALIRGITEQGSDVIDVGLCSTDMVYFACGKYGYGGGIMITASHNPARYNGLKFCREQAIPISKQTGLAEIQTKVEQNSYETPKRKGTVEQRDLREAWVEHALRFIDQSKIKPLKVAVDAGNGMAGYIMPVVAKYLPIDIVPLYFDLDGTFPNHPASPIEPENMADLQIKVREVHADIGIAFDGDADRAFITDEKGSIVSGTLMTAMIAREILHKKPNNTVLYNVICGDIVPETIRANHGTPIRTQVGHSIIKKEMRTHDAIFAGEHSGHYYFRDNYYADSGLIAALIVLELLCEDGRPLSQIVKAYDTYRDSGEINLPARDIPAKLAQVKAAFPDAQLDELDGLTVRYPAWWCNIRGSNTEPLLRLNVEAKDQETLDAQVKKLLEILKS